MRGKPKIRTTKRFEEEEISRRVSEILEEADLSPDPVKSPARTISTGYPALDRCVGGIPRGGMTHLYGDWDTDAAKTSIGMRFLANAQENPGELVVFIDADHAVAATDLPENTLAPMHFLIIRPSSMESAFRMLMELGDTAPSKLTAVVFSSISALVPEAEAAASFDADLPGAHQRALALNLQRLSRGAQQHDIAVLLIDQTRHKLYAYGDPTGTTGGHVVTKVVSTQIYIEKRGTVQKIGPVGPVHQGSRVRATVVKSKSSAPYRTCEFEVLHQRQSQK